MNANSVTRLGLAAAVVHGFKKTNKKQANIQLLVNFWEVFNEY